MELAGYGADDAKAPEEGGGDEGVTAYADVEGTFNIPWLAFQSMEEVVDNEEEREIPSRASSKQCFGSQWLVKMTTL